MNEWTMSKRGASEKELPKVQEGSEADQGSIKTISMILVMWRVTKCQTEAKDDEAKETEGLGNMSEFFQVKGR